MKTLLVLRHAKSSWSDPALPDHDRPLNKRGKRDAPRMGQLLKEQGLTPDLIISSTAVRAQNTAAKVAEASGYAGRVDATVRLYHAFPDEYLQILREVADEHRSVMVVGHNPALEDFLEVLTGQFERMPTSAVARVELEIESWQDLAVPPGGRLVDVWRPRELA
jgi:phosphohistidine phosphatase